MLEKVKELIEKFKNNKKAQIITLVVACLLLLVIIVLAVVLDEEEGEDTITSNNTNISVEDEQGEDYRVIDGVLTEKVRANLLPVAIIIENFQSVRPQNGLSKANIVYEALAEGGITRFLAIYADGDNIEEIGPVRSARHYFVDIAEEYGGLFAHIGGSPQALGILSYEEYLTDLNQFTYAQYYERYENLAAPHNLFTSSDKMSYAIRDLISENPKGDYEGWLFKDKKENSEVAEDVYIKIDYSSDDYAVEWKYNKENNNYERYNGGVEHKDANTDEIIKAENIIVQYAATGLLEGESERLDIDLDGEGDAVIFRDGQKIEGTWKKEARGERTKFYNTDNEEVELNRGQTWVEIVKEETLVETN